MSCRHRGWTLVELLISVTLTGILCLALATLAALGQRAFLADESLARLHENGRLALRLLQRELAMAGYLGWAAPDSVTRAVTGTPCYEALLGPLPALEHFDDLAPDGTSAAGAAIPTGCRRAGHYQSGSDALLVRRVADAPDLLRGDSLQPLDGDGTYLRVGTDAVLVPGSAAAGPGATVWRYRPVLLFARDYSVHRGDGVPALCRVRLSPGRFDSAPTECLLEGLERFQVEFAVDSDGDGHAERYVSQLAPGQVPLLARITVLMRSASYAGATPSPRTYQLGTHTYTAPDSRARLLLSATVRLRNIHAARG